MDGVDHVMEQKALKVLFVEDSVDDVELTLAELRRSGYQASFQRVETKTDMQFALDNGVWDVIICDYKMPAFTAEQALHVYHQANLDIPFIIVSGVVEAEEVVYLLKQGAHDFLNKAGLARLVPAIEREMRESVVRAERRKAEEKVSILSIAVEQSPVSVVICDPEGNIEYVNPKFEETTGYSFHEAVGERLGFTLIEDASSGTFHHLWQTIKQGDEWCGELCSLHKNGQLFWEYVNVSPLKDSQNNITHYIAIQEDVTVRRSYEEQLRRQAHYDDLTGLANRVLMIDRMELAIQTSMRNNKSAALLCIDLDHFKNINDTLGHTVGDNLLKEAVGRLASCARKSDTLARMGGDEFVIILPDIDTDLTVKKIADRIINEFARPFFIGGKDHFVTASIGIAKCPENGHDHQVLLRNADLAMYKAKELGRNQYQFFTEEINARLKQRLYIESALRDIEVRNELKLLYQPIIDMASKRIVACEALLRWRVDEHYLMPDKFIPIAEESGLIKNVGEWIIQTACKQLNHLHRAIDKNIKFAINISPKQLQMEGFSDYLAAQLAVNQIKPNMLELEITESVLMNDNEVTNHNLQAICDMGLPLSIDDFGTGYSSLGYLQKYPFRTLKIDRSFISQIAENNNNARLTETMIKMAHSLDMQVIAEGVENNEQLDFLHTNKCDLVQGFLFSKPLDDKQLITEIKKQNKNVLHLAKLN